MLGKTTVADLENSKEALNNIKDQPRIAIQSYTRLRNVAQSLKDAQPAAEGAAPHLVDYVGKLSSALREQMKSDFAQRLQGTMEQMKWPSKELNFPEDIQAQWRENVELLLGLQKPYVASRTTSMLGRNQSAIGSSSLIPPCRNIMALSRQFYCHWKSWCIRSNCASSTISAGTSRQIGLTRYVHRLQ